MVQNLNENFLNLNIRLVCCVFRPANACLRIRSHQKHQKMSKKSFFLYGIILWPLFIITHFTCCSMRTSITMKTTLYFSLLDKLLWKPFHCSRFSVKLHLCINMKYFLTKPLVHMMKKVLFSSFSNVFLFSTMRKHALAGRNTQQ